MTVPGNNDRDPAASDVRILDMADERGSFCGKLMADAGACVTKVEPPSGDPGRFIGPFWHGVFHPERSLPFWYHNTNKRGITLDIEKPRGRELFIELVKMNDVVIETFSPGYLVSLGLSYENLITYNPTVIMLSITGFGQGGSGAGRKSSDIVASAAGGQMSVCGRKNGPPLRLFGNQSYYSGSLYGAIAIFLALRRGIATHIDISLQESVASSLEHVFPRFFYRGEIPGRRGGLHWDNAFAIVPCCDGFLHITLRHQWDVLLELMNADGVAKDLTGGKWLKEDYRMKHIDRIISVVEKWSSAHTVEELFHLGQSMQFPWAPVYFPSNIIESEHLNARDFFVPVEHEDIPAVVKYPRSPLLFGGRGRGVARPPLIGESNMAVFSEEMRIPAGELNSLKASGVL